MAGDALLRAMLPTMRHVVGDTHVVLTLTRSQLRDDGTPFALEIHPAVIPVRELLDALLAGDDERIALTVPGPPGVKYQLTLTLEEDT